MQFKTLKDAYAFAIDDYNKWLENYNRYVQSLNQKFTVHDTALFDRAS